MPITAGTKLAKCIEACGIDLGPSEIIICSAITIYLASRKRQSGDDDARVIHGLQINNVGTFLWGLFLVRSIYMLDARSAQSPSVLQTLPMESPITAVERAYGSLFFAISNYALLCYDHTLTFGDEVEAIWSQPFNFATLLFYMNRYITHGNIIINSIAFTSNWPHTVCKHFVKFEGIMTVIMVAIADLILILRVYCLYARNKSILAFLLLLWTGQVVMGAVGLIPGIPVPLPLPLTGCVLTSPSQTLVLVWIGPVITDTVIFGLTLLKTMRSRAILRSALDGPSLLDIILHDGTLYFCVVFGVNAMNLIIHFSAPPDLKVVGASFSQVLSCMMVSRLQINLRRYTTSSSRQQQATISTFQIPPRTSQMASGGFRTDARRIEPNESFTLFGGGDTMLNFEGNTFMTLGNLGEELMTPKWTTGFKEKGVAHAEPDDDVELNLYRPRPRGF